MNHIEIVQPCITLLYDLPTLTLPDAFELAGGIAAVEGSPHIENIQVDISVNQGDKLLAKLRFDDHTVRLIGGSLKIPEEIVQQAIDSTHWTEAVKTTLKRHQSQIVLTYAGSSNPLEKMIALYKTAHALQNEHLLGIVNEPAWTSHPVKDTLDPQLIRSYRESIPFILWFGYIKIPLDQENFWLMTRGQHVFGLPDLVSLCQPGTNPAEVMNNFFNVFYYLYQSGAQVSLGDTLEIGSGAEPLRFAELPELPEFSDLKLKSKQVLLLEKIDRSETNKDSI